jgi:uncharacterized OB-fold protein
VGPGAGGDHARAGSPALTLASGHEPLAGGGSGAGERESPLDLTTGSARLVAGRCRDCASLTFPLRERCPACGGALERTLLPERGTLWTWTTQGFEPKSPPYAPDAGAFEPFAVGYVELPGCLRVEGRLTEADPARLRIGMPMRVVALRRGDRLTYAFAPADGEDGAGA